MIVKTFSGPNLRDALRNVRLAFGEDAVIIDTKFEAPGNNRLQQVHVTAAFEPEAGLSAEMEGPRTLHLKGGLAAAQPVEHTEETAPEPRAAGNEPQALESAPVDIPALAALLDSRLASRPNLEARRIIDWLATQPALAGEVIDAFAADQAESLPPYGAFLEREKSPLRVLFVGARGCGKSNALFKTYATRWRQAQNAPGLLLVSETSAHGHERLAAVCQSCGAPFATHALTDGRLVVSRELRRRDLFIEFTDAHAGRDLRQTARHIVRSTNPDVIVLVVSATETETHWERSFARFSEFRPTHLAVTRWDDDQPWWRVAEFASRHGLSLSYRTCGTDLFDEIDPFTEADVRSGLIDAATPLLVPPVAAKAAMRKKPAGGAPDRSADTRGQIIKPAICADNRG